MMLFSREIKNIRVQRWAMIFFVFLPVSCPTFDLHLSVCAEDFDPSFPPFFFNFILPALVVFHPSSQIQCCDSNVAHKCLLFQLF